MRFLKSNLFWQLFLLFVAMCLFTVTVEMRPGRVYYLLQLLLFRQSVLELLLYLAVFALAVWSQQVFLLNRSRFIRTAFLFVLLPLLFISLTYRYITGYNFAYTDAQTALNNSSFWSAALTNFTLPVVLALISSIIIVLLLAQLQKRISRCYSPIQAFAFIPVLLISVWYVNRSLGIIDDLPAFYRVPVSTGLASAHELPIGERKRVNVQPSQAGTKHLFLIVDESITGSSLSLNGNPVSTTPFLEAAKDSILNFGIASALANYSAGSNIALMSGIQTEHLPDLQHAALTEPSIFQYAKQAGYSTYFIDAQLALNAMQNYMAPADLKYIDHFIQPGNSKPELPYYMRDYKVAALLAKLSKADEKVFVYVNKVGAHWPYARTYPKSEAMFTPVLSERSMLKDQERSVNTYHNALRWTVDGFWKKLMQNIAPSDSTVVIYTSDHGQNLQGDGISIAHASTSNTSSIEANVPLWLLDKSKVTARFTIPAPNQQSQAQIFPTLLLLQGYNIKFIHSKYGNTLFESPVNKQRFFLTGDIFGRGNTHMVPFKE
ncbi:sulfatase-like hydrolase/transferase [Pontibacter sp. MBLB2868]|uniref:sulfatase-like hydrolase/transferase n=1 Tax=Pontibacter sp. MBLB2868 TaxID=3451555 RepID=UPI003F74C5DF